MSGCKKESYPWTQFSLPPSSSFRCRLRNQHVDALYNPTVGANLMSDEFALAFMGTNKLTPTDRPLMRPSGSLTNSYGILKDMSFWHDDVKIRLNFHVFEGLNFDFMIGHPLKALLKDVCKDGCLNIKLGKDTLHIPVDQALNCSAEDPPTLEPIEEIMATSTLESFDSDLEEDIEETPEEVIEADEDSNETFELLETEKPS